MREDGALLKLKAAAAGLGIFLENVGAGDVGGHQVRGELDATEGQIHRLGKGGDKEGLSQARDAMHEAVATGEDSDEKLFDDAMLADDDFAELGLEMVARFAEKTGGLDIRGRGVGQCRSSIFGDRHVG
jgi:hypothetical protein